MKSVFATNLKKARKLKNWSQEGAASTLNLNPKTYAKYEEGRAEPSHQTLLSICKVFEISDIRDFLQNIGYFERGKTA